VPPLRVLRRDSAASARRGLLAYAAARVVAVLIAWQAQEAQAASIMLGGVAGC
jgi:predicted lysophospholipase L1 biosynthesis ABC-type transport system permease subunit